LGLRGLAVAAILGMALGCAEPAQPPGAAATRVVPPPAAPPTPIVRARARWVPVSWGELPGFGDDRTRELWPALLAGCTKPADGWASVCALARVLQPMDDAQARDFLQRTLQPYRVESLDGQTSGLATGYFEPLLMASRVPRGAQQIALLRPPPDLATRKPWWTRAQLDTVPAARASVRGSEIAFVADPLDALLVQVQGSGRVRVTESDGRERLLRLAYAGHNDYPYKSVGRWLIDQGELRGEEASWPAIREWARRYPERINELVWSNPRVVFFREEPLPDENIGPRGAQGVAVDAGTLGGGRPVGGAVRHRAVARHHRAARHAAVAPRRDGAGHRQCDQRRGARRLLLGLGRAGRDAGWPHEAAAARMGAVAALTTLPRPGCGRFAWPRTARGRHGRLRRPAIRLRPPRPSRPRS
jgi:membrane-bound lytic murein transglycosylase A